MTDTVFTTVLIANRGEIARRIARTAREMGLRTVGVYTAADQGAPHTRDVDIAALVPSYLDIEKLVEAAKFTGADAVHPGYGFLSERAEFARAVTEAGLVWIGPDADVIERMGRKDAAREIAIAAGVPVVPQGDTAIADGKPVLVKAAAGGGGKGMRVVRDAAELPAAIEAAKRESLAAFGDDTMLIERYVEHGRHVEVQVLADRHGNVVHLYERDCSAQRRHQKVIEEAPAPGLSAAARETLLSSAVTLAREVGYTNAGTVEFMVAGDEVFFLEMNTRLQVEHPVTEATVLIQGQGLDLVRLQFAVAAGEPLPFTQDDVHCDGHAFEARIYAEDAWHGFLPQAGTATSVTWPSAALARTDHALESGQVVSTGFDPMLGKVIVHGRDREHARAKLLRALDATGIFGLTTNTGFLRALAASPAFEELDVDTAWLDHHADTLQPPADGDARVLAAMAYGAWVRAAADDSPFGAADGWRLSGPAVPYIVTLGEETLRVGLGATPRPLTHVDRDGVDVAFWGQSFRFDLPDPARSSHAAGPGDGTIVSPMPGTVVTVSVAEGDTVAEGDPLGVIEAMKMEHALKAPVAGTVTTVGAKPGDQVPLGHVLFVVAEGDADA